MTIYFASGNDHKKEEMKRLLEGYDIILPKEMGYTFDPEENGKTFLDNALIKAKALYSIVKAPVLADDSGLIVDARPDIMGVHTSRYGYDRYGKISSKEQYTLLLKEMEGEKERTGRFVCALVLYLSPNRFYVIQETMEGHIATEARGLDGFGYDPIFLVGDTNVTAAELSGEEKDKYSHRGKACRAMLRLIKEIDK